MDKIYYKNILVGIRITAVPKGSIPQTDEAEPLQLVTLNHPKDTYLKAHQHLPKRRVTQRLQECLIVKKGRLKLDLYTPDKKFIRYIYLKEGQAFILMNGGYGIHLLEDSELYEIKNGPFREDKVLI